jgi:hypothetical protein
MHQRPIVGLVIALATACAAAPVSAAIVFGPSPYLSATDLPAGFFAGAPSLLEDLEDNSLHPSLSASAGSIIGAAQFGSLVDSVDADDGVIDGLGQNGRSWFSGNGAGGVTFTYVGAGPLPTAFGIVWTDGGGSVTFEALDGSNIVVASGIFGGFADGSSSGTTGEDRFIGVTHEEGIKAIRVSNSAGGIELDHIQYGTMMAPVPEPGTWMLVSLGLGCVGVAQRRRRR